MEGVSERGFSQVVEDSLKWPLESKENLFSVIVPVITIIATQKMSQISIIWSLLVASGAFSWYRLYLNNQSGNEVKEKRIQKETFIRKYNLLTTYLPLDYTEMQKVFIGYELNEKDEKVKNEHYFQRQKGVLEACKTLSLEPQALENVWKSFPEKSVDSVDQFAARCRMLLDLMPCELKE
ncbi:MAG: hypothetical protein KR126chlam5_00408 [Candidatus Anoxychlamydiales bacterium]|nr:hypothetical protein [Candidatus Anoxychlamydiales bacterium]